MRVHTLALVLSGALAASCAPPAPPPAPAPPPPSSVITNSLKANFELVKRNVTMAAEQMPEAKFAYQPTSDVRTFGQLVGHVANANYLFCGTLIDGKPAVDVEKTITKKADLQKALAESFAFCDRAYASINDQTGATEVDTVVGRRTKLGALDLNTAHGYEHYGNMVTYFRLNKMVPPSSQGS